MHELGFIEKPTRPDPYRIISRMGGEIERRMEREKILMQALDNTPTASAELLARFLSKQNENEQTISDLIEELRESTQSATRVRRLHSRDGSCCRHCLTVYPCDTLKALEGDDDV